MIDDDILAEVILFGNSLYHLLSVACRDEPKKALEIALISVMWKWELEKALTPTEVRYCVAHALRAHGDYSAVKIETISKSGETNYYSSVAEG